MVGDILGTLKAQFVLTNLEAGYIGGAAIWGFTISIILLGYSLSLIVGNFELLVGTSKEQALLLAATAIVAFVVGLVLFLSRRSHLNADALADLEHEIS